MNRIFSHRTVLLNAAAVFSLGLLVSACDIEQTEEGRLPDVSVEGGNLPKYNVETPDVEIGKKTVEVTVPDVNVITPDEKKAAAEN